jgi:hypothetical protein
VDRLVSIERGLMDDLGRLFSDLKLDLKAAFQGTSIDGLSLAGIASRLSEWIERAEDLSTWTAYTAKEHAARTAGLTDFVNLLETGKLDVRSVMRAADQTAQFRPFRGILSERLRCLAQRSQRLRYAILIQQRLGPLPSNHGVRVPGHEEHAGQPLHRGELALATEQAQRDPDFLQRERGRIDLLDQRVAVPSRCPGPRTYRYPCRYD